MISTQAKRDTGDTLGWDVDDLKIWADGAKPAWWGNVPLRDFLTVNHRMITIAEAEAQAVRSFGADAPTKSAIGRFWLRLDQALGGPARDHSPEIVQAAAAHQLPVALMKAQAAIAALSEVQRIALAIQIVSQVDDHHNAAHVMRLGLFASDVGGQLILQKFNQETA